MSKRPTLTTSIQPPDRPINNFKGNRQHVSELQGLWHQDYGDPTIDNVWKRRRAAARKRRG